MPKDEYNHRLIEAASRMYKVIQRLIDNETGLAMRANMSKNEELSLKHDFNGRALSLASEALLITEESLTKEE